MNNDIPSAGNPDAAIARLETVVHRRMAAGDAAASYVASLAAKGTATMAQKLGEEAVETVIAAMGDDDDALVGEAADMLFHLTVLLASRGIGWSAITAELDRRHGTSGHVEKAARSEPSSSQPEV